MKSVISKLVVSIFTVLTITSCNANSKHQKHMKLSTLLLVFLLFLILSGCVHIESPHLGVVKDAETGKPIKGVVVHMDLESGMPIGPEGITKWKGSYETVTDKEGRYSLSIKLKGQLPLELSTGHALSFFKAGYLPSRILEPSINNTVSLYPIKYFLDYSHYKESAKKGDLDPPFMDKKPEAFVEYKKELIKMASLPFESFGDKGIFLSAPDAQFTKIYCRTIFQFSTNDSKPYTFGISDNACIVFDEASHKMTTFNAQGNSKDLKNSFPTTYHLVSFTENELDAVYANKDSIYIPNPPHANIGRHIAPQKGHIIGLAGDSEEYLTLEDNGLYLCYFSKGPTIEKGCISIKDVFSNDSGEGDRQPRFISLVHEYSYASTHYYVISKKGLAYQIHKVTHEYDSSGKTIFNFSEQFYPSLSADDEIIDFDTDGRSFFIGFKSGAIKKYSLDMYGKGPLKEDQIFHDKSHDLFKDKSISAVKLGWSVSDRVLYVTVGNSTVYRLSLDGVPDSRIRIIEEHAFNMRNILTGNYYFDSWAKANSLSKGTEA